MVASSIGIALLALVIVLFALDVGRGAYFSLIALLFAPYIQVTGSLAFRIEHILYPIALVLVCVRCYRLRRPVIIPPAASIYGLWWIVAIAATLIAASTTSNAVVEWLGAYGYIRPVILVVIFANVFNDPADAFNRLSRVFVFSAIPLGLLAAGQTLGVTVLRDITDMAFTSPGRPVMANQIALESAGLAFRALSVFENVSFAGTYFLLAIFVGVLLLKNTKADNGRIVRRLLLGSIVAAFVGGAFTLSSTFIGGLGIFIIAVFFRLDRMQKLRVGTATAAIALVGFLFAGSVPQESDAFALVSYQLTKLSSFSGIIDRYDLGSGQTADAVQATNEHPVVGLGFVTLPDVAVNDSLYVAIYYGGGVIGALVFIALLVNVGRMAAAPGPNNAILRLWLGIMLAAGISCTTMYVPRIGDWWWALVGIAFAFNQASTEREANLVKSGD